VWAVGELGVGGALDELLQDLKAWEGLVCPASLNNKNRMTVPVIR